MADTAGPGIDVTDHDQGAVTAPHDREAIPLRAQIGIGGVALAAAVLSFSSLRELAITTGTWSWIAFLLPVSLDAAAGVSMFVWMRAHITHVVSYARGLTWASIIVSIVCNGADHGFAASTVTPPWQAAVAVGAIPPIMFGAVIHLAFLARQPQRWGGPEAVTLLDEQDQPQWFDADPWPDEPDLEREIEPPTEQLELEPSQRAVTDTEGPESDPSPEIEDEAPAKPPRRRCENDSCGKLLPPGSRIDRRYCDSNCRQIAARERKAAAS